MSLHVPEERLDAALVAQTVPQGSMRYYSLLYAPAEKRDGLTALYLIEDELDATARGNHHDVAHTRLKWWTDEIDRLAKGKPAHPATRVLNRAREVFGDETGKLRGLVEAAAMDLALITYADDAELALYFDRSGGTLGEFTARWMAAPATLSAGTLHSARRLGSFIHRVEVLRDLRLHATAGRVHLPLSGLDAAGIEIAELRATPWPASVENFIGSVRDELKAEFADAFASVAGLERAMLRPLLVLAALHAGLLDRIVSTSMRAPAARVELGPFEKLWISWRAARRAV